MRALVAIEPRAYRQTIGGAIRDLRPHVEVVIVEPEDLEQEVARLDPELVLSAQPNTAVPGDRYAWIEFRPYEEPAARICIGGQFSELEEVGLEELLSVVDDTERLARTQNEPRDC